MGINLNKHLFHMLEFTSSKSDSKKLKPADRRPRLFEEGGIRCMSQHNDVSRYNPYRSPEYAERNTLYVTEIWEQMKTHAPKVYRKHQQMEASRKAFQPLVDAILDDSAMMAELESIMQSVRNKQYATEYALMGIAPGATEREIRNAYRRRARTLHPDKGGDEVAMKALNVAYKKLLAAVCSSLDPR
jgi:hypothetical protein